MNIKSEQKKEILQRALNVGYIAGDKSLHVRVMEGAMIERLFA